MGWFKSLNRQQKSLPGDADERREAIKDLHAIGDASATPTFIRALRDDDFEVQIAAAEALGDLRSQDALQPLADLVGDRHAHPDASEAAGRALVRYGRAATPVLTPLLDVPMAVEVATKALGKIGDPRAIDPLIWLMRDHHQHAWAEWALIDIGEAAELPLEREAEFGDATMQDRADYVLSQIAQRKSPGEDEPL